MLFSSIEPHLEALDRYMEGQVAVFEPEVQDLVSYCIRTSGKRLRPALVFFAGWAEQSRVQDDLIKLAAVIELVHMATLVHDDILDSASVRHGRMTVTEKYGSKMAVLLGDSLFAHAVNLSTEFSDIDVCRLVSQATRRVCAGEIGQTACRGDAAITLDAYYRLIELKTAELFQVSCFLGAKLAGTAQDFSEAAGGFGRHLGIAYQIYDDLSDFYGSEAEFGKTLGTDLANGKYTLPIILLFKRLSSDERVDFLEDAGAGDPEKTAFWLTKMMGAGVYSEVVSAIFTETERAEQGLEAFAHLPPTPYLMQISRFLQGQVLNLGFSHVAD
ncbi:MAG: polyprenyl synthetase family protein [Opitutales bacterium]